MPSPSPGDPSLAALTRALARGEDAAWREFHRTQGRMVFHYLLALTRGDVARADEALQQTYLRVAKHVRVCDQPAQWETWLRTVARSALADLRRGEGRFRRMLFRRAEEPETTEAEGEGRVAEWHARLDAALAALPAEARCVLERKYLRGESVEALACALGIGVKATESRLARARALLREFLENTPAPVEARATTEARR